ncbi:Uncharacterized conserved protein YcbK, DUF882 family [Nitrosomonas cryotolerans]|uniref:Murein endopeptidase K n=1 Tax=Nitrosomonas cryotolerans ATCC 49181 TaxID=1131553 RepID=A0A1N6JHV0_9PROT|nr:DUF882 domain-containing protein [Nitrosomonas cryotolerans]SFP88928.1 Uncharacterized conserved protein YcbK, DUF882 family [Nitrosomonas cryotolerans]SIO43952.1 Uncharacterized conserved protein YcbK, DUF882 family [Nitrosomonas cryotolerans ATCC 49181]
MFTQESADYNQQQTIKSNLNRRHFLKAGLGACALIALPTAQAKILNISERRLSFLNLHTGERVQSTYWAEGQYIPEALQAIEMVLRDHRTDERCAIDPNLLNVLQLLRSEIGTTQEFHVISGYRSASTNAMLMASSGGVAKKSLHMQGKAIDIRLPGQMLSTLRKAALSLEAGGVGYYPASDFLHIDTGRIRAW